MDTNSHTVIGTVGGIFLSIIPNIQSADVLKTALLAAIGAVVSFTISLVLKSIIKKHKK